ncbi:hypothetical protein Y032_0012g1765 [Ancylostoma ceylanicum]|uniref:Uncharacterized protein n=1 Tax=Ancylostoma ceylanicum TaxID=53326 RepID=A0A016VCQ9_9BILA|nr:hypothetical protein Y032_0012g1765 [Ancylostoma ceylanicum]
MNVCNPMQLQSQKQHSRARHTKVPSGSKQEQCQPVICERTSKGALIRHYFGKIIICFTWEDREVPQKRRARERRRNWGSCTRYVPQPRPQAAAHRDSSRCLRIQSKTGPRTASTHIPCLCSNPSPPVQRNWGTYTGCQWR